MARSCCFCCTGNRPYRIKALLQNGYIKAQRFKNAKNKIAYMYVLTPAGLQEKIAQTRHFLKWKTAEYARLKQEIETLRQEDTINSTRP